MLALLIASRVALLAVEKVASSNGGCWLGEECSTPVAVTLASQGWDNHIVYLLSLQISEWTAGTTMSVLISGEPALKSVGHPSGCLVVQSSEGALSVVLEQSPGETCSAVIQASRVSSTHSRRLSRPSPLFAVLLTIPGALVCRS